MAPPDETPENQSPAPASLASSPSPGLGGSFRTPSTVEFPMVIDTEGATMTAFGRMVKADLDPDFLGARISHVREVQYAPGSPPPDASEVASVTAPVTHQREHAWGPTTVFVLMGFAVVVLAGLAGGLFLTR